MQKIFVSSTFRDMHFERDVLHDTVLPTLNEFAKKYGQSVSLCDLRWGVNTGNMDSNEASKKVLSVCLDEIDRCDPYMIVIIGERYGWIPEDELIQEACLDKGGFLPETFHKSVTELEIEYGALREGKTKTLFFSGSLRGTPRAITPARASSTGCC